MKYILIIAILSISLFAETNWNRSYLVDNGYTLITECSKEGFLIEVVIKNNTRVEQLYCYDRSSWNAGCNHSPIKCDKELK